MIPQTFAPTEHQQKRSQIQTLKSKIEIVLEKFPETRNSDVELTIRLRKVFHADKINFWFVNLASLFDLPREAAVARVHAQIQNKDGRFVPTDREVAKKRWILEEVRRDAMGKNIWSTLYEK